MSVEYRALSHAPDTNPMVALIRQAVEGDRTAMRQLVSALTPTIRASVGLVLSRGKGRRESRQEVEDITQSVLLALFADRARALLQWDPARGLELQSFVGLLAKRETTSILRARRTNPWTEDPTLNEDLDQNAVMRMGPESETISRDMLIALADAVKTRLTARGYELFDMLFVKGLPHEEVCATTGLSPDAVYAWKSRLGRQVREILAELSKPPPTVPPERPGARETPPERPRMTPPERPKDPSADPRYTRDSGAEGRPARDYNPDRGDMKTDPLGSMVMRRRPKATG